MNAQKATMPSQAPTRLLMESASHAPLLARLAKMKMCALNARQAHTYFPTKLAGRAALLGSMNIRMNQDLLAHRAVVIATFATTMATVFSVK